MLQKLLKQFLKEFIKINRRHPQTPGEWMEIQNQAVRHLNKTKGVPAGPKKPPFQGFTPKVIEGGKGPNVPEVSGIDSLLKSDFEKAVKPKKDRPSIRLMKNFEREMTDIELAKEGYNLQEIGILKRARDVMKKEGQNPDDALAWVRSEMADAKGIEYEDFMTDFDWGDFPGKAQGGRIGLGAGGLAKGAKWFINSLKKNLTDMEAGHPRFKVVPAKDQETLKVGYRTFIKELEAGEAVPVEALEAISKNPQYFKTKKVVRSQDPDLAEVEELIDAKVFGNVRQELKDFEVVGRKPQQSGGLAYMLGEPTYMKSGGGSVGHGPWTTGQVQQQPQQQPQAPMHHAQGQPNPMKMPQGIPSAAPRSMDPRVMQQQAMQKAMMGQQGQRPRMAEGGTPEIPEQFLEDFKRRKYEDMLNEYHRWKDNYERRKDLAPTQEAAGGGRIGMMYGGDPGFAFEYGGSWADWHDQHRNQMPVEDYIQTKLPKDRLPFRDSAAGGGIIKALKNLLKKKPKKDVIKPFEFPDAGPQSDFFQKLLDDMLKSKSRLKDFDPPKDRKPHEAGGRIGFAGGGMGRRAFMKLMAGLASLPFIGKGLTKTAPKVIPKATETIARGADGMPSYIYDLIEVVKAKGTKDIIEGFKKSDYSNVHRYKGVEVIEDGAGNIKIKSDKPGVATDPYTGKTHEGIYQENHIQIEKGEWIAPTKTKKGIQAKDEYIEGTVYPDMDGKMKDFEEGLDEAIHLDFQKIADEGSFLTQKRNRDKVIKSKKASGGLAHMLGE